MSDPTPIPAPPQLTHPRQLIREKVASLLVDATNAGKRVWPSRVRHLAAKRLPAIGVYTMDEESGAADSSALTYERTVTVRVEIIATADDSLDDVLDTLSAQVEAVLLAEPTWGGVAGDPDKPAAMQRPTELVGATLEFARDTEGDREFACLSLVWQADYVTRHGQADESTLDAFRTAHFDWDLGERDEDGEIVPGASDTATLPQDEEEE